MFGIHWVWITMLLLMLFTVAAVAVGITFAVRRTPPLQSTVISPDGRWSWDGRQWRLMPQEGGAEPGPPPAPGPSLR